MGSEARHAVCGIISIGDMGMGIARLLIANNFGVVSNVSDRSSATQRRARDNNIGEVPCDIDLCNKSDYILSIVPPRDAAATAQRIIKASSSLNFQPRSNPLVFIDLNAISPKTARSIAALFENSSIRFIDGGIIGGPPSRKEDGTWSRPSIPVSGPYNINSAEPSGSKIAEVLNMQHVNDTIGSATGLKMCFASLAKGFTALAIQSFTTAHNLGVLPELKAHMEEFNPAGLKTAERSLPGMCPKAYRWVHEMREIAETFEADGGFAEDGSESPFRAIAQIYDLVANGTELGKEVVGARKRGKTAEDVAVLVSEGTERRKVKME
ncbi:6-phosphogluconate dehydrogenase [Neohortaea acidophila]|uniref:6-phosphogluconate dehydrogenase n=1 Tax=Neohortaea acidophila TaxID=245834 RepID=A0A6A6Q594_9PEZI|nr:6-phosphogluconate dehydrogenase [Neohortaea acidophila]KAF2486587.1 6-phosphogluconate dehydrogenase [Neohortaea acidophila]